MEWCIANRDIICHFLGEKIPAEWEKLFPLYRKALSDRDLKPRIDLRITPQLNMSIPGGEWGVSRFESVGSTTSRIEVNYPGVLGAFEKNSNGYQGSFNIESGYEYGLSTILHLALALLVEEAGGLVIHASGVLREDRVWLFCGPSGAGKSTIATELRDRGTLFSNDRVVVERDGSGRLIAFSTPFGDSKGNETTPSSCLVRGVVVIFQAERTRLVELSKFEVVKTLFHRARWCQGDTFMMQKELDAVSSIAETNLCLGMDFRKDKSFWTLLDAWDLDHWKNGVVL